MEANVGEEDSMRPFVADVHMHSIMSGHAFGTIRELAAAAAERGLQLIGVTDHAPGIPGACDPLYFRNFQDAPRLLYGVEMLYGSEVNILADGKLSLDRRHLDCLDYAVAGIHGPCYENAGIVQNTDNVIRCMEDPKVRLISHPDSDRYPLDYPALVQGAKAYHVALEVNNSSLRKPSLRPGCIENYETMVPLCIEYGVPMVVNTDSHDPSQVGDFSFAVALLERIGVEGAILLNQNLTKLKAFLLHPKQ